MRMIFFPIKLGSANTVVNEKYFSKDRQTNTHHLIEEVSILKESMFSIGDTFRPRASAG